MIIECTIHKSLHTANTPMQCNFIALSRTITTTGRIVQSCLWVVFISFVLWFPKPFFYSLEDLIRMDFVCPFFFFHFSYSHVILCGLFSLSLIFKYSINCSCFSYLSPIALPFWYLFLLFNFLSCWMFYAAWFGFGKNRTQNNTCKISRCFFYRTIERSDGEKQVKMELHNKLAQCNRIHLIKT